MGGKTPTNSYLVRVHCYGLDVSVGAKQALEHGGQRPPEQREADDEDGVRKTMEEEPPPPVFFDASCRSPSSTFASSSL